jgi:hypothetical protein
MEVHRKNFPEVMIDNDEIFIDSIIGITEAVDEFSSMEITNTGHSFNFRIAPSTNKYLEPILYEILKFSNMFGIHLDLSKSMKINSTINFELEII